MNGENGISNKEVKLDSSDYNLHYQVGELMGVAKALSAVLPGEYKNLTDLLLNTANNVKDPVLTLLRTGVLPELSNNLIQQQFAKSMTVENLTEEAFENEKVAISEKATPLESYIEPVMNDFEPKISETTSNEKNEPQSFTNDEVPTLSDEDFSKVDAEPEGNNLLGVEQNFGVPITQREQSYVEPQTLETTIKEDVNEQYRNMFDNQQSLGLTQPDLGSYMPANKVFEASKVDTGNLNVSKLPSEERYELTTPVVDTKTGDVNIAPLLTQQTFMPATANDVLAPIPEVDPTLNTNAIVVPETSVATPIVSETNVATPIIPESSVATPIVPETNVATPIVPETNVATPIVSETNVVTPIDSNTIEPKNTELDTLVANTSQLVVENPVKEAVAADTKLADTTTLTLNLEATNTENDAEENGAFDDLLVLDDMQPILIENKDDTMDVPADLMPPDVDALTESEGSFEVPNMSDELPVELTEDEWLEAEKEAHLNPAPIDENK